MDPEIAEKGRAWADKMFVAPAAWEARESVSDAVVREALIAISDKPFLHGWFHQTDLPTLVYRVTQPGIAAAISRAARMGDQYPVGAIPYVWPMTVGHVLTVTPLFQPIPWAAKVAVPVTLVPEAALSAGSYRLAFVHHREVLAVRRVDFRGTPEHASMYDRLVVENSRNWTDTALEVPEACVLDYLEYAVNEGSEDAGHYEPRVWPAADRLSLGWVAEFRVWARLFRRSLTDAAASGQLLEAEANSIGWWRRLPDAARGAGEATAFFEECVTHAIERPVEFYKSLTDAADAVPYARWPEWDQLLSVLRCLVAIAPRMCQVGKSVAWIARTRTLERMAIDADAIKANIEPERFWERMGAHPTVGLGDFVTGADVPADLGPRSSLWAMFPRATDPEQSEAAGLALLQEATASKQWTIPHGAILEIPFGPFTHLEVFEDLNAVVFVPRTPGGEYTHIGLWPDTGHLAWASAASNMTDDDRYAVFTAALLLLAAIIRDFWVVEERERVFTATRRSLRSPVRPGRDTAATTRIVYLPRVRYLGPPDVARCAVELAHADRRTHHVRAHFRRSQGYSEQQRVLASMYGFDLPTGYTFVRPHQRGGAEREVIYRSRSAMRSLFSADETTTGPAPVQWFAFERDVKHLMERLGFTVQHVAAARSGDRGVDLYATKGTDFDLVNWVVQCKCYHPRRSVGPAIVRELVGALAAYPKGTRGMLVTTSSFTPEADAVASEHQVRLVNGAEFQLLLNRDPPSDSTE